jgi:hypothetical protein
MARIDIRSNGAALNDGVLQLENGVAMDATLRNVADQNNTTSPLKLSTTAVQVTSPLRITTSDASGFYLDAEDSATNNRFSIKRDPSAQEVTLDFASNPAGSTTTVGAIRTYGDGVNLSNAVTFREDGQVTFSERVNVEADSLVTTEVCSVIAASTTNANLVIAPNGTGALIASIPDGTATGGNARGNAAVDLQMSRSNSNRVASGTASFVVGSDSRATSTTCVAMGDTCTASNTSAFAVGTGSVASGQYSVAMGSYPTASGINAISLGSNSVASSNYATVSGGQSNTASTNTHATVVGGQSNVSSGSHSVSGGLSNTASGTKSVSFGESNTNSASYSFGIGYRTTGYLYGQFQAGSGFFTANSDAQQSSLTARREATLTTGGTTVLSLDGTGVTNLIIPNGNNRMWNVQVRWVAVVSSITGTATGVTVGDTKTSTDLLAVAKRGGVTTVSAHTSAGTHAIETIAGSLTAANITYTAGASQEMAITFTGPTFAGGGSVTMRVVAAISLTEVAY